MHLSMEASWAPLGWSRNIERCRWILGGKNSIAENIGLNNHLAILHSNHDQSVATFWLSQGSCVDKVYQANNINGILLYSPLAIIFATGFDVNSIRRGSGIRGCECLSSWDLAAAGRPASHVARKSYTTTLRIVRVLCKRSKAIARTWLGRLLGHIHHPSYSINGLSISQDSSRASYRINQTADFGIDLIVMISSVLLADTSDADHDLLMSQSSNTCTRQDIIISNIKLYSKQ